MARGFVYLIAIVDWFSRRVLSWRLSITLETDFCIEALEETPTRFGAPEIFNTDQGSQFTSMAFTSVLHRERSPSAWMAAVPGGTMCLSNACGDRSNTKRFTCEPTARSARRVPRSAGI